MISTSVSYQYMHHVPPPGGGGELYDEAHLLPFSMNPKVAYYTPCRKNNDFSGPDYTGVEHI